MLRILHCADCHIDAPFTQKSAAARAEHKARQLAAFNAVIDLIGREHIDICLIAGDLFDTEKPSAGAAQAVKSGFARVPFCRFFITPGNHDPFTSDSVWNHFSFGENVSVFHSAAPSKISLAELNTDVYGYAFTSKEMRENPFTELRPDSPERISILVAHADMEDAHSTACPLNESIINRTGMDYVALGHIHEQMQIRKAGNTYYGYPGCLCGRDFGECGDKGVYLCTMDRSQGFFTCESIFVPIAKHRYFRCDADITGCTTDAQTADKLCEIVQNNGWDEHCTVRFTLTGSLCSDYAPSVVAVQAMMNGIEACEVTDETVPLLDRDELERDPGLRGAFYRKLRPLIDSADPEDRRRAELALKFGLRAMNGGDVSETGI